MNSNARCHLWDFEPLYDRLTDLGLGSWVDRLGPPIQTSTSPERHGEALRWNAAYHDLARFRSSSIRTEFGSPGPRFWVDDDTIPRSEVAEALRTLHPWRKGPFELFGVTIDAEWRSNMKWDRLAPHVDFRGQTVLDVGCGNGYYGWRMLEAGAQHVVGLEPYLLYATQHQIFKQFAPEYSFDVLPVGDQVLCQPLRFFDIVFSMGVLYHSKHPWEHLEWLRSALRSGGQLVLDTLIIPGDDQQLLIPRERYAQMRNVWCIPTTSLLVRMAERIGFRSVRIVDVSRTTPQEQRSTPWMTFASLAEFLSAEDPERTVEGEPAPRRALLIASAP